MVSLPLLVYYSDFAALLSRQICSTWHWCLRDDVSVSCLRMHLGRDIRKTICKWSEIQSWTLGPHPIAFKLMAIVNNLNLCWFVSTLFMTWDILQLIYILLFAFFFLKAHLKDCEHSVCQHCKERLQVVPAEHICKKQLNPPYTSSLGGTADSFVSWSICVGSYMAHSILAFYPLWLIVCPVTMSLSCYNAGVQYTVLT